MPSTKSLISLTSFKCNQIWSDILTWLQFYSSQTFHLIVISMSNRNCDILYIVLLRSFLESLCALCIAIIFVLLKLKLPHYTPWRRLGESSYSSYSFLTSALDRGWVVSGTPRPYFAPGKGPPVPVVQEARWAPEPVWTQRLEENPFASARDRTLMARSSNP
jgi:hypothetical protein